MKRFEGDGRKQVTLLPECVDDRIDQDNPVRIVDVFVDEVDLTTPGFSGTALAFQPKLDAPDLIDPTGNLAVSGTAEFPHAVGRKRTFDN
jgi:hypothetical protein